MGVGELKFLEISQRFLRLVFRCIEYFVSDKCTERNINMPQTSTRLRSLDVSLDGIVLSQCAIKATVHIHIYAINRVKPYSEAPGIYSLPWKPTFSRVDGVFLTHPPILWSLFNFPDAHEGAQLPQLGQPTRTKVGNCNLPLSVQNTPRFKRAFNDNVSNHLNLSTIRFEYYIRQNLQIEN